MEKPIVVILLLFLLIAGCSNNITYKGGIYTDVSGGGNIKNCDKFDREDLIITCRAVNLRDFGKCNELSNIHSFNNCIGDVALFYGVAPSQTDKCDLINDEKDPVSTSDMARQLCKARLTGNIKECYSIKNLKTNESYYIAISVCITSIAESNKDVGMCGEYINNVDFLKNSYISGCLEATDTCNMLFEEALQRDKDLCYLGVAKATEDKNICYQIVSQSTQDLCISNV